MKLRVWDCGCGCGTKHYGFASKPLFLHYFRDREINEWFFYVRLGKTTHRFSSCGYTKMKAGEP